MNPPHGKSKQQYAKQEMEVFWSKDGHEILLTLLGTTDTRLAFDTTDVRTSFGTE